MTNNILGETVVFCSCVTYRGLTGFSSSLFSTKISKSTFWGMRNSLFTVVR